MTGSLVQELDFGRILFRWRNWAGSEDPAAYVSKLVQGSDQDLVDFLVGMTTVKVSSQGEESVRTTVMIQETVNLLIDPKTIEAKVREIKDVSWDSLSDKQKIAVDAFFDMANEWGFSITPPA